MCILRCTRDELHTVTQPSPCILAGQAPAQQGVPLQLQQEGIDVFSKLLATVLVVLTPESLGAPEQGKALREKLRVAI